MADEKSKNLTGADGPDKDPAQPEAGGSPAPGKAQKAPEAAAPEKTVKEPEKATPEKVAPQRTAKEPEKTAPQKAAKEPEKPAPEKEAKEPEKAAPAKEEKKPEIPKEQKVEAPEGKEAPNVSFGLPADPFPTLLASDLTPFAFWFEDDPGGGCVRFLTERESERLMGLPEGWTAYGADGGEIRPSARYKALGNSIALPCADYIMAGIYEALAGKEET